MRATFAYVVVGEAAEHVVEDVRVDGVVACQLLVGGGGADLAEYSRWSNPTRRICSRAGAGAAVGASAPLAGSTDEGSPWLEHFVLKVAKKLQIDSVKVRLRLGLD
jgi:hypothetical protein